MKILMIHNDYGAPSGEETEFRQISDLLTKKGHRVDLYTRSSCEFDNSVKKKFEAFFYGIHNPLSCKAIAEKIQDRP